MNISTRLLKHSCIFFCHRFYYLFFCRSFFPIYLLSFIYLSTRASVSFIKCSPKTIKKCEGKKSIHPPFDKKKETQKKGIRCLLRVLLEHINVHASIFLNSYLSVEINRMGAAITAVIGEQKLISLIWFSNFSSTNQLNDDEQKQSSIEIILKDHLGSNVNYLKICSDAHQCQTYIQRRKNERIVLVVADESASQIETLISYLHDLRQFHSVYILNTIHSVDKITESSSKFSKVSKSIIFEILFVHTNMHYLGRKKTSKNDSRAFFA
jgi:hypothetical protein